jgi:hypothetical protein
MNNKEFTFTLAAEMLSKEILDKLRKIQMESALRKNKSGDEDDDNRPRDSNDLSPNSKENLGDLHSTPKTNSHVQKIVLSEECLLNLDEETKSLLLSNAMDQRLDKMMKDWYSSHDMLFSMHPVDGSILIWLVDWLDEYVPGGFRQAQISFHAKLPNAIPVGDAVSMSSQIILFSSAFHASRKIGDESDEANETLTSITETSENEVIKT